MTNNYAWGHSFHPAVDAQVVGEVTERLTEKHGSMTPDIMVRAATAKKSPIHDCFTWDDSHAAHEHRKGQARKILRALVIVLEPDVTEPAFLNVQVREAETASAYKPLSAVLDNPDDYEAALRLLVGKVNGAQRSLQMLRAATARHRPRSKRTKVRVRQLDETHEHLGAAEERLVTA